MVFVPCLVRRVRRQRPRPATVGMLLTHGRVFRPGDRHRRAVGAGVPRRRPTGSQVDAFGELRDPEMFHALADLDRTTRSRVRITPGFRDETVRVPGSMRFPHAGGSSILVPGRDLPGRLGTPTQSPFSWSHRERRRVRAADTRDLRAVGPGCEGGGAAVSAANLVGLVLSILVVGYLVLALVFPERF